jgi:hypothetical protein
MVTRIPSAVPACSTTDPDPVGGAGDRLRAGVLDQRDAAGDQGVLQHGGGVGVLVRQDLVAAGHHRHLHPELGVGVDELRAGDAGADDHQMLGQLVQVVELAPVQDPLTVGFGAGQDPRAGAGGDEHHVGLQGALPAVVAGDLDGVGGQALHLVDQLTAPGDQRDTRVDELLGDVGGLGGRQPLDPLVDLVQRRRGVLELDGVAQVGGAAQLGAHTGRGDERLGRDTVVEHAGTADAVGVDDGDVGDLGSA